LADFNVEAVAGLGTAQDAGKQEENRKAKIANRKSH
jgi:hypothetical protein